MPVRPVPAARDDAARRGFAAAEPPPAGPVPAERDRGRFPKGMSGNPAGRPRGSRDARTVALAELVDASGDAIVRKLCEAAEAGQPWAIRLVVEKILPRLERRLDVQVARVETAGHVAGAVADVIQLASEGALSIEEAKGFLGLLEVQRRAIETSDLAVRLDLLEQNSKGDF